MGVLSGLGRYFLLLRDVLGSFEKGRLLYERIVAEMEDIGINSIPIVALIAIFTGAVTTVQTAYQIVSKLITPDVIGAVVSDSMILELAPTISSLVLAGRVGSSIASQIGSMRVTEQIDALDVMGVNTPNFLIFPKLVGGLVTIPLLILMAMVLGIASGMLVGDLTGVVSFYEFVEGARASFRPYTFFFALTKSVTFAFLIVSISAYQGYFVRGGALEVGRASTRAVVFTAINILLFDYILAQLLL